MTSQDVSHCTILPEEPEIQPLISTVPYEETEDSEVDTPLGCGVFLAATIAGFVVMNRMDLPDDMSGWFWLAPFAVAAMASKALVEFVRDKRRESLVKSRNRNTDRKNQAARKQVIDNAQGRTRRAQQLYGEAFQEVAEVQAILARAHRKLDRAESEYQANAFSSFWDELEEVVQVLAEYSDAVRRIGVSSESYSNILSGRSHDFPQYPITTSMIPDGIPTVRRLQAVSRLGDTNFQFAQILEQRRTREALIAGFENLTLAVSGIEGRVVDAISASERKVINAMNSLRNS
ncbi:MAG: hypothetical protein QNJ15_14775 [Erythrobacter sp.]|nr:hypothetical protein [Erythrobacter sp.]